MQRFHFQDGVVNIKYDVFLCFDVKLNVKVKLNMCMCACMDVSLFVCVCLPVSVCMYVFMDKCVLCLLVHVLLYLNMYK